MASDRIKTEHSARLRLVHGEDCEGCQDIGLQMALHIVHLAGWRIVRTGEDGVRHGSKPHVAIFDEWTPDPAVSAGEDPTTAP